MESKVVNPLLVFFQIQAFFLLILLYVGVYFRKRRKWHVRIMGTVISWDILLVLQIELTRNAIDKASKYLENPFLLNFHISLALSTVIFYFIMIGTGRSLLKGNEKIRPWHKKLGLITLLLRTLTFITSFFAKPL